MIAIVYPQFYGVGGIARYLDSFLANLPVGHPPIYLITGDEHQTARNYAGVEIIHIPFTSNRLNLFIWSWQARKQLIRLYQVNKIKWVNLHFPPLIPGLFLPKEIPVVLTAHTTYLGMSGQFYPTKHFDSQWGKWSLLIKKWMENQIFMRTQKVITLTEQGRQEVLAYGFNRSITVIPNGADTRLFVPNPSVDKDIDVLFCGRIEFRKGSRSMVELCLQLITQKPDIRIAIVGYGDDFAWVKEKLSSRNKNVLLTGKVSFSETIAYYNRSKLYASTSYYEGLPGTCLEAMAMHLPVVAWDFLFYHGLVVEGKTGALIAPNDFYAMTDTILALLADPQRMAALGQQGRALLVADYNWSSLAKDVLRVFDEAV